MRHIAFLLLLAVSAHADEATTSARLESIRRDPVALQMFLQQMPKGGDLHNHLSGTVYGESYIVWAAADKLCIDTQRLAYVKCEGTETQVPAAQALTDSGLYQRMLDAISMRQFRAIGESGHDHFFATFGKFGQVSSRHTSEMLTEVVARFARENVDYVESLFGQDQGAARALGRQLEAGSSFDEMRTALAPKVPAVVASSRATIDAAESFLRKDLECGTAAAKAGCESTVRYLFESHRAFPREQLFAELVVGFELAKADSRVVGLNVVQPEDSFLSMTTFDELMRMFAFLRPLYPGVRISTHAGELAPGLVPPEGMANHIRDSVTIARAERIGHGVDLAHETDAAALLREMAAKSVAVEVCLTSNDVILGVTGTRHPLRTYMRAGVPVLLATDDPGVSRNDMTTEFQRAVEEQGATYAELKAFARNSLEYSFLEGEKLGTKCADAPSPPCTDLLRKSAKARVQVRLERRLTEFEAQP